MKVVKAELTAKILITAMIVILVGVLIVWMTGVFSDKKADINSGTGKIESETNDIADFDISAWDGETIGGKALIELIYELWDTMCNNFLLGVFVAPLDGVDRLILQPYVKPGMSQIHYTFDEEYLDIIVPTGIYKGKVEKYKASRTTVLTFTQQK